MHNRANTLVTRRPHTPPLSAGRSSSLSAANLRRARGNPPRPRNPYSSGRSAGGNRDRTREVLRRLADTAASACAVVLITDGVDHDLAESIALDLMADHDLRRSFDGSYRLRTRRAAREPPTGPLPVGYRPPVHHLLGDLVQAASR